MCEALKTVSALEFGSFEDLKKCTDFSYVNIMGKNLLTIAAKKDIKTFKFIYEKIKKIDESCLTQACVYEKIDIVKFILQQEEFKELDTSFSLKCSCSIKNYDIVRILLENGANPNISYSRGDTLLNFCITNSTLDIIRLLLQYKANPDAVIADGFTPFLTAIYNNNVKCAILLRTYGANPYTEITNSSILSRIVLNLNYQSLYSFLNVSYMWPSFYVALSSRNLEDVKFLVENREIDLNFQDGKRLLNFIKRKKQYREQPEYSPALYDYIEQFYKGWNTKIHKYYSTDFKESVKMIIAKLGKELPLELWFIIFNFIKLGKTNKLHY